MFPTQILLSFSFVVLSAAALGPASDNPAPDHPPPVRRNAEPDHLHLQNIDNTTHPLFTPPPLTTTNALQPICFNPQSHSPRIQPDDCHTALYNLLVLPDALNFRRWDRTTVLPTARIVRTCSIVVNREGPRSDDTFQPVLIAHAAALVVQACVTARYSFQGGYATIGAHDGFVVDVSASGTGVDGTSATA